MKTTAICKYCQKTFEYYTTKTSGKFCSKKCQHAFPPKGSVWLGKNGYYYIQFGRKRKMLLHRVIAGAKPGQVVHHKDGNPKNNDLANLEILDGQSAHVKIHGNPVLARWAKKKH